MKFDPCYEYYKAYQQVCGEWIGATQAMAEFQREHLCPSKQWQDVKYTELKRLDRL